MKNKIRTMTKYITINLIIFIVLFFVLDIFIFYRHLYMSFKYDPSCHNISYIKHISRKLDKNEIEKIIFEEIKYRPVENKEKNYKSIILFGCSFTEGASLANNETFSHILAKGMKRGVYNRAHGGWGTQHMLYQLRSNKFYELLNNKKISNTEKEIPQYIIYTYITDHINRIHIAMEPILFGGYPTFVYKKTQANTLEIAPTYLFRFPLISFLREFIYFNYIDYKSKSEFLKLHITQSKEAIEKNYKKENQKPKLVILIYYPDYEIMSITESLVKEGIIVISAEELIKEPLNRNKYFISKEDKHPNKQAWEKIVPQLKEYLESYNDKKQKESIKYIKSELEKEYRDIDVNKKGFNLKEIYIAREGYSDFSICAKDKKLESENKISKRKAYIAYILWSIENLTSSFGRTKITKELRKLVKKINPNNETYKKYYERYYSE